LGQVAVELAQAAALLRGDADAANGAELAAKLETQAAQTLREAAASGCDLAALRTSKVLSFLQNDAIWDTLGTSTESAVQ
jgi:hypothetical protein